MLISAPPLIKWTVNFHDLNAIYFDITILTFLTLKKDVFYQGADPSVPVKL